MSGFFWAVIATLFAALIGAEGRYWSPQIANSLLNFAVRRLPSVKRERLAEEWAGRLMDIPGYVGPMFFAIGCVAAAQRLRGTPSIYYRAKVLVALSMLWLGKGWLGCLDRLSPRLQRAALLLRGKAILNVCSLQAKVVLDMFQEVDALDSENKTDLANTKRGETEIRGKLALSWISASTRKYLSECEGYDGKFASRVQVLENRRKLR